MAEHHNGTTIGVFESSGLNFILSDIFIRLDCQSIINCELVSITWKDIIVENRVWRKKLLRHLAPPSSYNRRILDTGQEDDIDADHWKCRSICQTLTFGLEHAWTTGHLSPLKITEPKSVRDIQINEDLIICATSLYRGLLIADRGTVEKSQSQGFTFGQSSFIETSEVSCFAFDDQTRLIGVAHRDRRIVFWRQNNSSEINSFVEVASVESAHSRLVTKIKLSKNLAFSSSRDRTIKIWSLHQIRDPAPEVTLLQTLETPNHSVWTLDWCRPFLVTCSTDKCVRVWKCLKSENQLSEYCVFQNEWANIRNAVFLQSHPNLILSGDLAGELNVWNVATQSLQYTVQSAEKRRGLFNDAGPVVAISQSRTHVAVAFGNYRLTLYSSIRAQESLRSTKVIDLFEEFGASGLIRSLYLTDTDLYVASVAGEEGIFIFSALKGFPKTRSLSEFEN